MVAIIILLFKEENLTCSSSMSVGGCDYSYKIKLIIKKKKPVTKQLYNLRSKFKSVKEMKNKIKKELREEIYGDIGYFEGKQSTKRWIMEDEDLSQMYMRHNGGEIYLWYDRNEDPVVDEPPRKKRKEESGCSRRQIKDDNVEKAFNKLVEKHSSKYTKPQFKLWARMIVNDLHESYDQPPNVPLITGVVPKPKKESMSDIIAGAAAAIVKAITPVPDSEPLRQEPTLGISPCRSADIRLKNLQQLKYIKELYQDNVLSESEFTEQKLSILEALRTL